MEQATLRPVPLRPVGRVDPAEALAHVLTTLPELSDHAARALALTEIAGRTRDTALEEMEVAPDALAELLYVARKALRRSLFPLSASGWCERAERLLSDRIDGVLVPPGPARLDVHLRNCDRCVDHERRLSQARERLVREFIDAHPHTAGAGPAERPAAALRVVEPVVLEPAHEGPSRPVASFGGADPERGNRDALPRISFAGPGGQSEMRLELSRPPVLETEDLPADPPFDDDIPPSEPGDTSPSEHDAEDAEPPVEDDDSTRAVAPVALVWGALNVSSLGIALAGLVAILLALYGLGTTF